MIKKTLENLNLKALNEMQNEMLRETKDNREIVLLAPTGSGKTLGFLLPAYLNLKNNIHGIQVLVIVPSRELAIQIEQVFKQMGTGFKINSFYGGHSSRTEKNNLKEPPAILIGTPGRLSYHFRTEHIDPSTIHTLVLDEFDKSLEFGFTKDMSSILKSLTHLRRKILTSATDIKEFPSFIRIREPHILNYLHTDDLKPVGLSIVKVMVQDHDKIGTLIKLLQYLKQEPSLIFFNHREGVDKISELLKEQNVPHGVFQGGMEQSEREVALIKFRNGSHTILLCTDLASRGLDIPELQNIIHYQLPHTENVFTHRNGRTARMKAEGRAILLMKLTDTNPTYLEKDPEILELPENISKNQASDWVTLHFPYGRKEKINKVDIAGILYQAAKLERDDVGIIEVSDHDAFAAIKTIKLYQTLDRLKPAKIKNKIVKAEIV